jgi:hypothetical protein
MQIGPNLKESVTIARNGARIVFDLPPFRWSENYTIPECDPNLEVAVNHVHAHIAFGHGKWLIVWQ